MTPGCQPVFLEKCKELGIFGGTPSLGQGKGLGGGAGNRVTHGRSPGESSPVPVTPIVGWVQSLLTGKQVHTGRVCPTPPDISGLGALHLALHLPSGCSRQLIKADEQVAEPPICNQTEAVGNLGTYMQLTSEVGRGGAVSWD